MILELAVRGKLVPQDPNDEPASVLLKRITDERDRLVREKIIKKPKKLPEITEEKCLENFPTGWSECRLGSVMNVLNGRAYKKHEMLQEGTPLLRVGNLFTSKEWYYSDLELEPDKYIDSGDLIYAWSASFGPFIWDGGKAIYHYHIWKLDFFDKRSLYKPYIFNFLLAITEEIKASGNGIAMVHMTKDRMEKLILRIPPYSEQIRISERVEELMALCDQLEEQAENSIAAHQVLVETLLGTLTQSQNADELAENWQRLAEHFDTLFTTEHSIDQLKQTILQLAVMGKLVPQDPNDEPASVLLERIAAEKEQLIKDKKIKKQKVLPPISEDEQSFVLPEGWAWERWNQVALKIGDIDHKMPDEEINGIPYVSPRDFYPNNVIKFDDAKKISLEDFERLAAKIQPKKGDIIFPRYGTIGANVLVETDLDFLASYSCCVIKTLQGFISPSYQFIYSISSFVKDQCRKAENKTTQANVGIKSIQEFVMPIPPLDEQYRIADKVNKLMTVSDELKARLLESQQTQLSIAKAITDQALQG
ncbi:restriction endonuclease subunit S [Neptuniibacter sp. QD48_11]|uniref:restriction endonuclease subunit S n=1 Tax=Neptuniibacter sp. QD48_11 TaxID=3398211 RepID=UPI0039F5A0C5